MEELERWIKMKTMYGTFVVVLFSLTVAVQGTGKLLCLPFYLAIEPCGAIFYLTSAFYFLHA